MIRQITEVLDPEVALSTTSSNNQVVNEESPHTQLIVESCDVMHPLIIESNIMGKKNTSEAVSEDNKISTIFDDEDFECTSSECDEADVHKIQDKPVVCRAKATLPASFLCIHSISNGKKKDDNTELGVFAKKDLSKRTLFGPMEGCIVEINSDSEDHELKLLIYESGSFKRLDVSNYNEANWMRYVRPARSVDEQNLILYQNGRHLYFSTTRNVKVSEELKVWYSSSYAKARNLKLIQGSRKMIKGTASVNSSSWCCSRCHTCFASATLLNLHVLTHAADNIETKDYVENNVTSSTMEEKKVQENEGLERKFICNICSKPFLNMRSLGSHLKYHELIYYQCPICKVNFFKLLNLKKHIPTHQIDDVFTCPHCGKKFSAYKTIRNHIRTYHAGKKYHCVQCPKCFPTSDKLKNHMLSHSERKEFLCANCGKQFKRKDKLSEHMKKFHIPGREERPLSKRTKGFKQFAPLKENDKQLQYVYKCHICVIGFKRRGMLVNHLANRHPEVAPDSVPELNLPILKANKDYFCQYCDKVYKSSSKRKAHILKYHPGVKLPISSRKVSNYSEGEENGTYSQTVGSFTASPHSCDWCHKQYASKAKLLQHQRNKHHEKLPKSLQVPRRKVTPPNYEDEIDTVNVGKVTDSDILLYQDPMDSNIADGEFIIDANTLKRALKGEVFIADCTPETLAELGQIFESRADQYFRVYQTSAGITFARPVEVWDPLSTCQTLGPPHNSPPLSEL